MIYLGLDIGSSSIKASLFDAENGNSLASVFYPTEEMEIISPKTGWAEQDPKVWFNNVKSAIKLLKESNSSKLKDLKGIGISYQMHGLVCLDKFGEPIRNAIIWCDSRAVEIGNKAFQNIGEEYCLENLLNSPGNFTASKLRWVQENEPENYKKIHKVMLPGDYIAYRLTGEMNTTESGLSEGIFWDFANNNLSQKLLDYYNISPDLIPDIIPTFSIQGYTQKEVASELGIQEGTPVAYRAGDQANNAFSLNVLEPGEIAATAGTSGVVYGVMENQKPDTLSRVNTFLHVNHNKETARLGMLLCINGTGIFNSWIRNNMMDKGTTYEQMNEMTTNISYGSEGLMVFPFGNGAERILENKNINSQIQGLDLNKHSKAHFARAAQEGIVFAMIYGLGIMKELGLNFHVIKVAKANMFLSPVFTNTFASLSGAQIELYDTDGAEGAARGAALGTGFYKSTNEAFASLKRIETIKPIEKTQLTDAYLEWEKELNKILNNY